MSGGCCCVAVILSVCVGLAILVVAVCFGLRLVEKPTSPNDSPKVPLVGASTPMSTTSYKTTSATTTISTTVNPLTTPSGQEGISKSLVLGLSVSAAVIVLILCCWYCCCDCRCDCCCCCGDSDNRGTFWIDFGWSQDRRYYQRI
ncbi:uncharacterized protein LOC144912453 [Branchiostoma floridae x Branchiostoma belcheri]